MKIQTGNFGTQALQLQRQTVTNPEVGAVEQAQSQAAGIKANAAQQLDNTISQIGQQVQEHYQRIGRLNAQQRAQDFGVFQQSVMEDIDSQVQQGQLDSKGAAAAWRKALDDKRKEYDANPISDLGTDGKMMLEKSIGGIEQQGQHRMAGYVAKLAWNEEDRKLDQTAAQFGQMSQMGMPLGQVRAAVDKFYDENAAHYGQQNVEQKKAAMNKAVTVGNLRFRVEQNQNDNAALTTLKGEASGYGLDDNTLASIYGSIDGKISRNDAKAIAAQNHADSLALRRETAAVHADDKMQERLAKGEIPTDDDWSNYQTVTSGTSVGGQTQQLQQTMQVTQELYRLPPAQAQAVIDARRLELTRSGGSAEAYKVLEIGQRTIDRRAADLKENPQAVAATDAGAPLMPIDVTAGLKDPGTFGALLQDRLTNAQALIQKYGPTAGKSLLTKDELTDAKQYYSTLNPDQRVQFWRNTNASAGYEATSQLAKDMGGNSVVMSAVASGAGSKTGYQTALTIEKGQQLLTPVDGAAKAKAPEDAAVAQRIKAQYPMLTPSQVQQLVPAVSAFAVGSGRDPKAQVSSDDLKAVIGEKVKVLGQAMIVPAGQDTNSYTTTISSQVSRLPADRASWVRNGLTDGTLTFIPDSVGNLRLINADTHSPVIAVPGGSPFIVRFNP